MLFEFKSRATGSVVMTNDVGKRVLPLIGKTPDPKGIITVEQMPAAIAALEAACRREKELAEAAKEKARRGGRDDPATSTGDADRSDQDDEDDPQLIGICQRVLPLIEMMRTAHAAGKDITWGV
ncbi:MAG: DUF1840 domain-containing protein [Burkholderiaceae bacterium]|nr:DUF1840 domain-containing protein [Burkholderiaceae bacterium]